MLKVVHQPAADPNLAIVKRRSGDKHQTYFLTIYESALNEAAENVARDTLRRYFTEYSILNALAVVLRANGDYAILTYIPFKNIVVSLPREAYRHSDLYFDKLTDFMGHPLKVSLFSEEVRVIFDKLENLGADYFIAELLAQKLNSTLLVLKPTDKEEYGNPTSATDASGSLGQVVREEVDISLNSRFLRLDLFYNNNIAEPTVPIGRDDMCILVPRAAYKPMIYNLWQSLEISAWLMIAFITLPYAVFVHYVSTSCCSRMLQPVDNRPTTLDIVRSFLNQSLPQLPEFTPLRALIIFWIMYCFLINNILQSCLTSSLTVKRRDNDINSIAQLSASPYRIVAATDYARLIRTYFSQSGSNQTRLTDKLWPMPWNEYNEYIGASDTRYAYANKHHMTSHYAKGKLGDGLPLYNAMPECLVPFLACYIVPFGSPYLGRFNDIISWTEQAGIMLHWERSMNEHPTLMAQHRVVVDQHSRQSPLHLKTMAVFFHFWTGGMCISLIAFLVEILKHHRIRIAREK